MFEDIELNFSEDILCIVITISSNVKRLQRDQHFVYVEVTSSLDLIGFDI